MMGFAKERGQISRQRIGEFLPFRVTTALQEIKIFRKGFHAFGTQLFGQSTVYQFMLAIAERDAGMLIDQFADTLEILLGKLKLSSLSYNHFYTLNLSMTILLCILDVI
jgi:hypothetical protein